MIKIHIPVTNFPPADTLVLQYNSSASGRSSDLSIHMPPQNAKEYRNIAINKFDMGATKTDLFTDKQNAIALLTKALGHPARVAIIDYLLSVDTCICGDIVSQLPLAQPTVSQHLRELKNAGLIKGKIEGNAICYCIDEKMIARLQTYFDHVSNNLAKKKKAICC